MILNFVWLRFINNVLMTRYFTCFIYSKEAYTLCTVHTSIRMNGKVYSHTVLTESLSKLWSSSSFLPGILTRSYIHEMNCKIHSNLIKALGSILIWAYISSQYQVLVISKCSQFLLNLLCPKFHLCNIVFFWGKIFG